MLTTSHRPPAPEYLRRMSSPIGRIELGSDGKAITSLTIERGGHLPWEEREERTAKVLERAVSQLDEYFGGKRTQFALPVVLVGTSFQQAVWSELSRLSFGQVISYGALGLATGRPTAGRAVGGAVGANPIPIIVPCHRVLASSNRITGYSAGDGVPTKSWLLTHEGIPHAA